MVTNTFLLPVHISSGCETSADSQKNFRGAMNVIDVLTLEIVAHVLKVLLSVGHQTIICTIKYLNSYLN